MKFCQNCFIDKELKRIIASQPEKGRCPICGCDNTPLYDTDTDQTIQQGFENLLDIYTFKEDLPVSFPEDEIHSLADDLIDNWNIFAPPLSSSNKHKILSSILKERIKKDNNLLNRNVGIVQKYDDRYIFEYSILRSGKWEDFVDSIKKENRFHNSTINLKMLGSFCSHLVTMYKSGKEFYRGRISENLCGIDIKDMSAPPPRNARPGRANAEGISRLYLASDERTAIHEIRAGAFDYITIGKFIAKQNVSVVNFRLINQISPFDDSINPLIFAINKNCLEKIDKEMAKVLRQGDSHIDYIPTQYIADYLNSREFNNELPVSCNGVEYKSTMNPAGYNLSIFDKELFECAEIKTIQVSGLQYNY